MSDDKQRLIELSAAFDAGPCGESRLPLTELAEIIKTEGWTLEQVKEVLALLHDGVVDETDKPAA
jgi:hypothetical protein